MSVEHGTVNCGMTGRASESEFDPGDLVLVRKQVKSRAADGVSAKLSLSKPKGLTVCLEKSTPEATTFRNSRSCKDWDDLVEW